MRRQYTWAEHVLLRRRVVVDGGTAHYVWIADAEIHIQRPHDHATRLVELLEDSLNIVVQLIAEMDVAGDDGRVRLAVRPGLVVAGVGVLEVAGAGPVIAHER